MMQAAAPFAAPPHPHPGDGSMQPHHPLPPQFSQPMKGIAEPHHNDVLCGRGVTTNRHKGNENFRGFVNRNKALYVSSTKRQKMTISRSIVEAVRNLNPPGRFLEKDVNTGLWFDVGDKKAIEKTSQALRDGAANLRKQLSEDLTDPNFVSAMFGAEGERSGASKDDKQAGKQSKKKGDKTTPINRSFSDSLLTPSLTHEPRQEQDKQLSDSCPPSIVSSAPSMMHPPGQPHSYSPAPGVPPGGGPYDSSMMHIEQCPPGEHPSMSGAMPPHMRSSFSIGDRSSGFASAPPHHPHAPPHEYPQHPHHHHPYHQQRYDNYPHPGQHVVSPCPSTNSPPYSPPNSPPYSQPTSSSNQHGHHHPYGPPPPPPGHPYSPNAPNSPPPYQTPHQSQTHPYWSPSHLSPHATTSNHPYQAVTPEGRPYSYGVSHHPQQQHMPSHYHSSPSPYPGTEQPPHEYVEVTHDGNYQFSENAHDGGRTPISPASHDGDANNRSHYRGGGAYPPSRTESTERRHPYAESTMDASITTDRESSVTPSPTRMKGNIKPPDRNLFDDDDDEMQIDEPKPSSSSTTGRTHTEFTPPRNRERRSTSSRAAITAAPPTPTTPISLGSGKLDDIWLQESPLMYDQKSEVSSSNSSIKSGDSFLAPLPYRTTSSSDFSPFLGLFCGCAPSYCPSDISGVREEYERKVRQTRQERQERQERRKKDQN